MRRTVVIGLLTAFLLGSLAGCGGKRATEPVHVKRNFLNKHRMPRPDKT